MRVDMASATPDNAALETPEADDDVRTADKKNETLTEAVLRIQKKFREPLKGVVLDRRLLIERLRLERKVMEGWMTFVNSMVLFLVVTLVLLLEQRADLKLDIQTSAERTFELESLKDIRSIPEFQEYLSTASQRTRTLQPLSTEYFWDEQGTIRLCVHRIPTRPRCKPSTLFTKRGF